MLGGGAIKADPSKADTRCDLKSPAKPTTQHHLPGLQMQKMHGAQHDTMSVQSTDDNASREITKSNALPRKEQTNQSMTINIVRDQSYKIQVSREIHEPYNVAAILDMRCGTCLLRRADIRPE